MEPGDRLLGDQFTLLNRLSSTPECEYWTATDVYSGPMLLKAWPFGADSPSEVLRASWNAELRNLLRVSSSPEAESHLVVIKRSGIDYSKKCFVMALSAPGMDILRAPLSDRAHCIWLREIQSEARRAEIWKGLRNLAMGLSQLHQQQILHRNLNSQAVMVDDIEGPISMRLGGFEWSVRIGSSWIPGGRPVAPPLTNDSEYTSHSFESDWLSFALLAASILIPHIEPDPTETTSSIISAIQDFKVLTDLERNLLLRTLDLSPRARLARSFEIISKIDEITRWLDRPSRFNNDSYLALVVLLGPGKPLTRAIIEQTPRVDPTDIEVQRKFIEQDLAAPTVVSSYKDRGKSYVLIGQKVSYHIREYEESRRSTGQWNLAFSQRDAQLRYSSGEDDQVELDRIPIRVFTALSVRQNEGVVRQNAISWKSCLPRDLRQSIARERQQKFHDFFRITNQLELLFRDAEVFPYSILQRTRDDTYEMLTIAARERTRPGFQFAQLGGLGTFLENEIATTSEEKSDAESVYLGKEDSLWLTSSVPLEYFWSIEKIDEEKNTVVVQRRIGLPPAPNEGFLRTYGMFGQMSLIKRRKQAIERLQFHNYLLEALQNPYFLFVDTGETNLPIPVDSRKIDDAKALALSLLWRTRPIFALQGPPGTGKTTLVANLLGQIFQDDAVSQVLVTAQAHAAVDVLREKVSKETFKEVPEDNRPLSIRLPKGIGRFHDRDPDSLTNVTLRILERAETTLADDTPLKVRWAEILHEALLGLRRGELEGEAGDLRELVRRSAGITYSTTTAGHLEELANMTHSYDWSLIEEAGKAHGFDLVLPLQTGHRWLLIGDHKQLPPYNYENFQKGLENLDDAVGQLMELPERAGGLVDMDLIQSWRGLPEHEKAQRRDFYLEWLQTFRRVYENCCRSIRYPGARPNDAVPELSSMLSQQHRMHPTIGDLISRSYYDGRLHNATYDNEGNLKKEVVHPFSSPHGLLGKAVLWIDVPKIASNPGTEGLYTSMIEVEAIIKFVRSLRVPEACADKLQMAVLSPYRLQVGKLKEALRDVYDMPPVWLRPKRSTDFLANTVDSFQGNQADLVIVSLVRNNSRATPRKALGFLRESSRMNVLLSRAERLLVLTGNLEFFKKQLAGIPADSAQPLGHLRILLDFLEAGFQNGKVSFISA